MNRLTILFVLFCLLAGCEKTVYTSSELWKSLVNETDRDLFYVVHTTERSDSAFADSHDSIGFYFEKHKTIITTFLGGYIRDIDHIFSLEEELYNLTDTCSFFHQGPWVIGDWRDTLYQENIFRSYDGNFLNEKNSETLVVTDTLFSIMQKDSTMLEKFGEYYNKK
ncbi:MAG: hypothetical protein LBE71_04305 [Dysgonamonadaceae bacterium]|jgi:hypothetical protein|nr:hypothetical protein [Dysgonamonadaceae bacterium]